MLHTFDNATKQHARRRERERQLSRMEQAGAPTVLELLCEDDINIASASVQERKLLEPPHRKFCGPSWRERFVSKCLCLCLALVIITATGFSLGFEVAEGAQQGSLNEYEGSSNSRYDQFYSAILEWGFTSRETLDNADSPQGRALKWLSDDDIDTENLEIARTRFSMATIFFSTNFVHHESGANSMWHQQSHWMSSYPVCLWHGVDCAKEENTLGRVQALNLSSNGLAGSIPPEIALLQSDIRVLDMRNNEIEGTIPKAIEYLKNLGKGSVRPGGCCCSSL